MEPTILFRRNLPSRVGASNVAVLISAFLACLLGCGGGASTAPSPKNPVDPGPTPTLASSVNHIVVMVEENRSFDSYFGKLADYWQQNGYPAQAFDGLPTNASNPAQTGSGVISSFHLRTTCTENMDPAWNNSHVDWNRTDPTSATATLDGFVSTAAAYSQNPPPVDAPGFDVNGYRAMGYYDSSDLNYYYFMASNFATSDRWFSPAMTRTQPNRLYLLAATSAGHVNPPTTPLTNNTIFGLLQSAGISWKIYETDPNTTFLGNFQPFETQYASNIAPLSEYYTDLTNGTLPSVAMVEPGYDSGTDEHPGDNVQLGAAHVADIINALMASSSWKDSVFLLTFDEAGGSYDHVAPQPAVQPDGIPPSDLNPGDICTNVTGPNCDFTYTGYRVPLIVISPFTRKNYVSHTVADYTAILKFIETRFNLPNLTHRDAAQMDMTEFFDFQNPPWTTPPTPPAQVTTKLCDETAVP